MGTEGAQAPHVRWSLRGDAGENLMGHQDSSHSSGRSSYGDSAAHMYLDLRPFMDRAPTTVRFAASPSTVTM